MLSISHLVGYAVSTRDEAYLVTYLRNPQLRWAVASEKSRPVKVLS
jgi:hypothetical protein